MEKQRYSIGEVSKITGLSQQTLRRWDDTKRFIADYRTPGNGKRFYNKQSVATLLGQQSKKRQRKVIGYCRVSNNKQKDELEKQVSNVKSYLLAQGKPFEILTDIGSGINYSNKNLNKLINLIDTDQVSKVVILYKDRLVKFGYELIENIAKLHDTSIEIIDTTDRNFEEDLTIERINDRKSNKIKSPLKKVIKNEREDSKDSTGRDLSN